MRRAIIFFTLIVIFLSMYQLSRMAQEWHYIVSAPPGELIYATTFDDGAPDWEQYDGQQLSIQAGSGAIRLAVSRPAGGLYTTASPYVADFDVRVDVRVESGVFDGMNENAYGVVFRQKDTSNYYVFLVSSDGSYRLRRVVDNHAEVISAWIFTDAIDTEIGAVNTLRVVGHDDRFQFYINDERMQLCIPNDPGAISTVVNGECLQGSMVDTLYDNAIGYGQVGVSAEMDRAQVTEVIVEFDNFLVYGPQPIE